MRRAASEPLEYAPPTPWRRKLWRRVGIALLVISTLVIVLRLGPIAWHRAEVLHWQKACLNYQAPADQVVFKLAPPQAITPAEWTEFYRRVSPAGSNAQAVLFLHERISRAGNKRLVAIEMDTRARGGRFTADTAILWPRVFTPATPFSMPGQPPSSGEFESLPIDLDCVIYAGQPDPQDTSHFTIRIVSGGMERILDGWLLDNDRIKVEPRPITPATNPSP